MNKQDKNQVIDRLADKLNANPHFYLADISGLTVEASNQLRRKCFEKGISLEVVKNKLLLKAMEKSGDSYAALHAILSGPTSILFSEVANEPAKIIKAFRKTHDKPVLKGAFVELSVYVGDDQVDVLAALKSRNELIAEVIALLQSPAKNVVSALQSGKHTLAGLLKTLEDNPVTPKAAAAPSKEESAPAQPEASASPAEGTADSPETENDSASEEKSE